MSKVKGHRSKVRSHAEAVGGQRFDVSNIPISVLYDYLLTQLPIFVSNSKQHLPATLSNVLDYKNGSQSALQWMNLLDIFSRMLPSPKGSSYFHKNISKVANVNDKKEKRRQLIIKGNTLCISILCILIFMDCIRSL